MVDKFTAPRCLFGASAQTFARRLAAPIIAVTAITTITFIPVSTARAGGCAHAHTRIAGTPRRTLQKAVLCLVNQQRRDRGLPRLEASRRLNRSAQSWTTTMVSHRHFSHGADFAARISAVGFDWSNVAENIATGFPTPAAVVRGWMASIGHCQNILSPTYREVGTGVSKRAATGYSSMAGTWTQDFGLLMNQRPASGNWAPANGCPYN